ncbi:MAG: DUF6339 family protein [Terriglobales bacterium]
MRLPVITNLHAVLNAWRSGEDIAPAISFVGNGSELPTSVLDELVNGLEAIKNEVEDSRDGRIQFDKEAAVLLGTRLQITPSAATERRFWSYFGIVKAPHLAAWRWGKQRKEDVNPNRFSGGPKDTFKRLWLRANVIKEIEAADPYALARLGGEDFWVSVLERQISGCRELMKAVVRVFFPAASDDAGQEEHRAAMLWLREVRPARIYEAMSSAETTALAATALNVARQKIATSSDLSQSAS